MLQAYRTDTDGGSPLWFDLTDPTAEEIAQVAESGVQVPSRSALEEIESSSRLRASGRMLYLSMPLAVHDGTPRLSPLPLGFVLSPDVLVTIRYSPLHVFNDLHALLEREPRSSSAAIFTDLIDGMVDFSADVLEKLSAELAAVSNQTFGQHRQGRRDRRVSGALRDSLGTVGGIGDHLSRLRESVLGLQRILGFVCDTADEWMPAPLKTRLQSARQDLTSLADFETHLSGKTQFLLDAILGFINTEQNDIFKVLTIVSVVGIPPTLIASMYGMNFHDMPELSWRLGYPYGLTLIALSTLVPILWFKRRGWW